MITNYNDKQLSLKRYITYYFRVDKSFINSLYKLIIFISSHLYTFLINQILFEIFIILIFFNYNYNLFSLF